MKTTQIAQVKGIRATRNKRGMWTLVTNSYNGSHKSLDLLIRDSRVAVQQIEFTSVNCHSS